MSAQYTLCAMYDPLARTVNEGFPFHQLSPDDFSRSIWETNIPDNTTIDDMRRHIADGDNMSDGSSGGAFEEGEYTCNTRFQESEGLMKQHVSLIDVYSDIKVHATAIVYIVRALVPKIDLFIDVMRTGMLK